MDAGDATYLLQVARMLDDAARVSSEGEKEAVVQWTDSLARLVAGRLRKIATKGDL